jgi:Family of unknown function (DUF6599)
VEKSNLKKMLPPKRRLCCSLAAALLLCSIAPPTRAFAQAARTIATAAPAPLLPQEFAGFALEGKMEKSTAPGAVDAGNAQVLVEYGFRDFASANYKSSATTVGIRAMRFADATGAYGAYTFFRIPGMHPEEIGKGAAANGARVLFWEGATLVDAKFDHLTMMSAASLRELAAKLPIPMGTSGVPPSLPGFLPRTDLEVTHTRYSLGTEGYTRSGGVLPAALIDFSKSPEVLSGDFSEESGEGTLTIIEYPTPQIAAERQRAIEAYLKAGNTPLQPFTAALESSNTQALAVRRSGLLLAVTSGGFNASDAHRLLNRINYEASVTWNSPQGYVPETTKAARLLVGIAYFCLIACSAALMLGIFLGGGRALFRKMRGKPASTLDDMEFIKLDLR